MMMTDDEFKEIRDRIFNYNKKFNDFREKLIYTKLPVLSILSVIFNKTKIIDDIGKLIKVIAVRYSPDSGLTPGYSYDDIPKSDLLAIINSFSKAFSINNECIDTLLLENKLKDQEFIFIINYNITPYNKDNQMENYYSLGIQYLFDPNKYKLSNNNLRHATFVSDAAPFSDVRQSITIEVSEHGILVNNLEYYEDMEAILEDINSKLEPILGDPEVFVKQYNYIRNTIETFLNEKIS